MYVTNFSRRVYILKIKISILQYFRKAFFPIQEIIKCGRFLKNKDVKLFKNLIPFYAVKI